MIAEYRKNHKDKQRPHNTRPDENTCRNGKAHLGTGDAEQAEIPKPAPLSLRCLNQTSFF